MVEDVEGEEEEGSTRVVVVAEGIIRGMVKEDRGIRGVGIPNAEELG